MFRKEENLFRTLSGPTTFSKNKPFRVSSKSSQVCHILNTHMIQKFDVFHAIFVKLIDFVGHIGPKIR